MSGTRENETFIAFLRGKRPFNATQMTFPSRQTSARRVHIMVYMAKVKEARGYGSSDREIGIFRVRLLREVPRLGKRERSLPLLYGRSRVVKTAHARPFSSRSFETSATTE